MVRHDWWEYKIIQKQDFLSIKHLSCSDNDCIVSTVLWFVTNHAVFMYVAVYIHTYTIFNSVFALFVA